MSGTTSLTSYTLTVSSYTSGTIDLPYDALDFTPSATDSYKSTSGDVFKVFINGIRIYRQDDSIYASGNGFLETTDNVTGNKLNNITDSGSTNWGRTSNTVWVINTTANKIVLNPTQIAATTLYGSASPGLGITVSNGDIIELRRAVQDLKTPAVDFSNASILTEQDLDNSAKNVFHVAQQAVTEVEDALIYNTGTASYQSYVPGTSSNAKISNVATPTATTDAANKAYVDGSSNTVTVATNIANVNTVAGISGNVTTVAGNTTNINTVAGNNSNINTVATNNTNVTNVGGDIANVNTVAGSIANVNTVAGSIANVNTVATNIGTISAKVSKSGDTMTGALTLSGAPTADNHASTKAYTDSQATALALALG